MKTDNFRDENAGMTLEQGDVTKSNWGCRALSAGIPGKASLRRWISRFLRQEAPEVKLRTRETGRQR